MATAYLDAHDGRGPEIFLHGHDQPRTELTDGGMRNPNFKETLPSDVQEASVVRERSRSLASRFGLCVPTS